MRVQASRSPSESAVRRPPPQSDAKPGNQRLRRFQENATGVTKQHEGPTAEVSFCALSVYTSVIDQRKGCARCGGADSYAPRVRFSRGGTGISFTACECARQKHTFQTWSGQWLQLLFCNRDLLLARSEVVAMQLCRSRVSASPLAAAESRHTSAITDPHSCLFD